MIFHIASQAELKEGAATYEPGSVADEGFIHCAESHQVLELACRKFSRRNDIVLMKIDSSKVRSEIRYENLSGSKVLFPHIYGPLNMDAVLATEPLRILASGDFDLPDCLHDQLAST